jgi:hypothetical protein
MYCEQILGSFLSLVLDLAGGLVPEDYLFDATAPNGTTTRVTFSWSVRRLLYLCE